jgi:hypothetical protein
VGSRAGLDSVAKRKNLIIAPAGNRTVKNLNRFKINCYSLIFKNLSFTSLQRINHMHLLLELKIFFYISLLMYEKS